MPNRDVAAEQTDAAMATGAPARWLILSTLLLSIAGLGVSSYLTISHFTDTSALICTANSVIDCTKVTTSAQSIFLGFPVAGLGMIFFVAMVWLSLPGTWRLTGELVRAARLVILTGGLVFVFYLVWSEVILLHAICEWCTAVHVITLALFVLVGGSEYRRRGSCRRVRRYGQQSRRGL